MEPQNTQITKILLRKIKNGDIILPDFKIFQKSTVIKIALCGHKNRAVEKTRDHRSKFIMYIQLPKFYKGAKILKYSLFRSICGIIGYPVFFLFVNSLKNQLKTDQRLILFSFETWSPSITLATLELTMYTRLTLNLQRSAGLCLPSARIEVVHPTTNWIKDFNTRPKMKSLEENVGEML